LNRKLLSIDRIAADPKQAAQDTAVGDSMGEQGMSEPMFYGRRRRYARVQSRQLKELKLLQNENTRLKKLVTELRLDKSILQNVARLCSGRKLSS
jgi:putative transposase